MQVIACKDSSTCRAGCKTTHSFANSVIVISLTECRYFIPPFVELTSSDVAENRRQLAENGIIYPIGMYCIPIFILTVDGTSEWARDLGRGIKCVCFVHVSLCCCCSEIGSLTALCFHATVCKPSLAHCNGQSIPLQADREEVVA